MSFDDLFVQEVSGFSDLSDSSEYALGEQVGADPRGSEVKLEDELREMKQEVRRLRSSRHVTPRRRRSSPVRGYAYNELVECISLDTRRTSKSVDQIKSRISALRQLIRESKTEVVDKSLLKNDVQKIVRQEFAQFAMRLEKTLKLNMVGGPDHEESSIGNRVSGLRSTQRSGRRSTLRYEGMSFDSLKTENEVKLEDSSADNSLSNETFVDLTGDYLG